MAKNKTRTVEDADAELAIANAEITRLKALNVTYEAELVELRKSVEAVATGHFDTDKKVTRIETELRAELKRFTDEMQETLRKQRATWAETATAHRAPASAATRSAPEGAATTNSAPRSPERHHQHSGQQQHRTRDAFDASFVTFADSKLSADDVVGVIANTMGVNTGSFSVQKLSSAAAKEAAAEQAAPTTSAPAPPPRVVNVPFIFRTTKYIAEQAVKGSLRRTLKEKEIRMFIDDHLTREQQQERKRREGQRRQLKDAGVTVAWRQAALVKWDESIGDKGAWAEVPPAPPSPAAAAQIPATVPT
jgi:hypothetical protein